LFKWLEVLMVLQTLHQYHHHFLDDPEYRGKSRARWVMGPVHDALFAQVFRPLKAHASRETPKGRWVAVEDVAQVRKWTQLYVSGRHSEFWFPLFEDCPASGGESDEDAEANAEMVESLTVHEINRLMFERQFQQDRKFRKFVRRRVVELREAYDDGPEY
jgi:hypothetical protein